MTRLDRTMLRGGTALLTMASLALTGCTHLAVSRDLVYTQDRSQALSGVTYSLPMLQYDLTVSRTLATCPSKVEIKTGGVGETATFWSDDMAIALGATATANQIPGERYWVDYSKLDSWMKTTSFTIEYQPGGTDLLKGINVSAEDHTGAVIGNVVKAGLAVAAVAAGPAGMVAAGTAATVNHFANANSLTSYALTRNIKGIGVADRARQEALAAAKANADARTRQHLAARIAGASVRRPLFVCASKTDAKLLARKKLAVTLTADNDTLDKATKTVEELTKLAAVRALNPARRTELGNQAETMLKTAKAVAKGKKAIADIETDLGVTKTETWPKRFSDDARPGLAALEPDDLEKLAALFDRAPIDAAVIDAPKLARELASDPELPAYRKIAKDFIDKYVDENGRAETFSAAAIPNGCAGQSPDLSTCLASLTTLQARIVPVKSDNLPRCVDDATEPCLDEYRTAYDAETARQNQAGIPITQRKTQLPRPAATGKGKQNDGLFVRPPVRATLTICRMPSLGEVAGDAGCAAHSGNLVKDDKLLAPQFGQLRYLRLVNQAFSNNGLIVSLTKDGAIEKFQYASTKSIAEGLSAAAADAASQAAAFDKARREEAKTNSDPVAALQKQIDLKTAQQKLAALDAVTAPSEFDQIQLAKLKAEVELDEAQTAYTAAQTAAFASKAADQ